MNSAEKPFELTFPMYALLHKDGTGTIMLKHDQDIWLPLFTEDTNVLTYAERSGLGECLACELATPTAVDQFVRQPPSRNSNPNEVTTIIIDPIDNQPRVVTLFPFVDFVALLAMHQDNADEDDVLQP